MVKLTQVLLVPLIYISQTQRFHSKMNHLMKDAFPLKNIISVIIKL